MIFIVRKEFHRTIRKVIKIKGVLGSDGALLKLVYLVYCNIKKKVDHALGEQVLNRSATLYKVRGTI